MTEIDAKVIHSSKAVMDITVALVEGDGNELSLDIENGVIPFSFFPTISNESFAKEREKKVEEEPQRKRKRVGDREEKKTQKDKKGERAPKGDF